MDPSNSKFQALSIVIFDAFLFRECYRIPEIQDRIKESKLAKAGFQPAVAGSWDRCQQCAQVKGKGKECWSEDEEEHFRR